MQVVGKFIYYARLIDDTMMHALNNLATAVNDGTQATVEAITYFLNYCASNQNATKLYRASDMILTTNSNTAYLLTPKAQSRGCRFHYLGNKDKNLLNGSTVIIAKIIKAVMSSAAKAEVRALYINAKCCTRAYHSSRIGPHSTSDTITVSVVHVDVSISSASCFGRY